MPTRRVSRACFWSAAHWARPHAMPPHAALLPWQVLRLMGTDGKCRRLGLLHFVLPLTAVDVTDPE
eukprot:9330819-Pyramimonas_sp.AAC.1